MVFIIDYIHSALLIISFIMGIMSLVKKGFIKSMATIYVYTFIGIIFELALFLNDGINGGGYFISNCIYPLIFPTCVSISVIIRLFDNCIKKIIIFSIAIAVLFITLDEIIFNAVSYLIAISAVAIIIISYSKKLSFKWFHIIDVLFLLNLFESILKDIMTYNYKFWNDSVLVNNVFFYYGVPATFLYLILINVKFWRSSTH